MGIELEYNKIVNVLRLQDDESGETESYATHLTGVSCHIQALDDSYSEDIDGNFGKEWLMFCEIKDILEGDRIVDGALTYKVVGTETYEFGDDDDHMEVRIRLKNP